MAKKHTYSAVQTKRKAKGKAASFFQKGRAKQLAKAKGGT